MFTNSRLREMLGYEEGELEGKRHWELYHPDYQAITRSRGQARLMGEPVVNRYEVMLQRKDGSSFDCELVAKKVRVRGKSRIQAWFRDITERKQAEDELRKSEEKYRRLHETMMDAFVSVDMTGRIQETNLAYQAMLGYSEEELRRGAQVPTPSTVPLKGAGGEKPDCIAKSCGPKKPCCPC